MQQVRVHGPGDVRVDDVPDPEPGPRDALVRMAACGICGTDLSYIRLGGLGGPGPEPLCLGHEMAGTVDWVGDEVDGPRVGDRVVVFPGNNDLGRIGSGAPQGGLTPLLLVTEAAAPDRLVKIPDHLPLDVAALAEPLNVAIRAVEQAEVEPGDPVAVFGCGPIGLCAIAALRDRGIDEVVAVDLSPTRLRLAAALGASPLNPSEDDVWGGLADLHGTVPAMLGPAPKTKAYIEASGAASVFTDIMGRAAPGSVMSVVALHWEPVPASLLMLTMKEMTIRGSMEYPARFGEAVELLDRHDLSGLITDRFALDDFEEALVELQGSKDCGKVLIEIDG